MVAGGPGGVRTGQRYVAPHLGALVGRFPQPGGASPASKSLYAFPKQINYRVKPHVLPVLGAQPQITPVSSILLFFSIQPKYITRNVVRPRAQGLSAPLGGPLSRNLQVRARYARYGIKTQYQPFTGYGVLGPPPSHSLQVRAHYAAYRTRPRYLLFTGYSPVGVLSVNFKQRIVRAKQPPYGTHPLHGGPIVGAAAVPPVGFQSLIRAKQPKYITRLLLRPWIGPYPKSGSVSRPLNVRAKQPEYRTRRLIRPWIGPYPRLGSVSRNRQVKAIYARYPVDQHLDQLWVYRVPQFAPVDIPCLVPASAAACVAMTSASAGYGTGVYGTATYGETTSTVVQFGAGTPTTGPQFKAKS